MKISLSWLKDHLQTDASVDTLVEKLIQLGHEVDGVEDTAAAFKNVVIGHIIAREQHPNADRLGVCQVDVGADEPLQIVCGAPNARVGITVAVALVGAVLPGDFNIKKSKIRGEISNGMICSVSELGLGDEHDGIWEMDTKAKPGTPLSETMDNCDVILEIAVTPNRGDCLSVRGLARDLAAGGVGTLVDMRKPTLGKGTPIIKAKIETDKVYAFNGLQISGVTNGESPKWMKHWLKNAGLRPRSLLVDVTNYIMLTYGRPLHAYDADKVKGNLTAKEAKGGETYTGIGALNIKANKGDILICDNAGVVGLGGILGGERTAVTEETTNVYLECAWFDRYQIAKTGQTHNILSDARYRGERGVDPSMALHALQAAAWIITKAGGGKMTAVQTAGSNNFKSAVIKFNPTFVETFGGIKIPEKEIEDTLNNLGFTIKKGKIWQVKAPVWRTYMETPEDLVEEILRVKGYENIPSVLPEIPAQSLRHLAPDLALSRQARRIVAGMGFLETITYSFIGSTQANRFSEGKTLYQLSNPLDEETMATMCPSLLPGLLDAVAKNMARSDKISRLAEIGKVFADEKESWQAAGVLINSGTRHWQGDVKTMDVFDAKAASEKLLTTLGAPTKNLQCRANAANWYHPGRSGTLSLGKDILATFGELHPAILKMFSVETPLMAFEVNLQKLTKLKKRQKAFVMSPYQPVEKDLAFVLDEAVPAADVLATVRNTSKELIQSAYIFDVYQGKGIKTGKKSLALSMTLQAVDRTLTDEEIKQVMDEAINAVSKHHSGELRA